MSYFALYRKYRPDCIDDLIDQDKIVKILSNSIKNNKISHAYLFYGPRGTGKTTVAKLVAKMVNCLNLTNLTPCNKCDSCIQFNEKNNPDIVEIDAASNNGVDEIREIREKVKFLPSISKYRIYIVDEVHMLSPGAFNALLKTLEEPPEHVIFILATTEYHKVPVTIVSRCQCFEFSRISDRGIVKRLKYIADKEKIAINDDVLGLIAHYSGGALRDAIGMFDKLSLYSTSKITTDDFYYFRGIVNNDEISELFSKIIANKVDEIMESIANFYDNGKDLVLLTEELLMFFRNKIVDDAKNNNYNHLYYDAVEILYKTIVNMKNTDYARVFLELSLIKIANLFKDEVVDKAIAEVKKEELMQNDSKKEENVVNVNNELFEEVIIKKEESIITLEEKVTSDAVEVKKEFLNNTEMDEIKKQFVKERINNAFALANKTSLKELKDKSIDMANFLHNREFSSVVSYLIDGNIRVVGDKNIIISLKYDSLVENANSALDKIESLFSLLYNKYYKIVFVSDERWNELKNEYIASLKNGNGYNYIDETILEWPRIVEETKDMVVEKALDLFDEDLVEIE